jgi:hypothetical protein
MMAFIWIALVYVIVAFADITAGASWSAPKELRETPRPRLQPGRRGRCGERSSISLLALVMGVVQALRRRSG